MNFKGKIKPQNPIMIIIKIKKKERKKKYILKNLYELFDGRERLLDAFESTIFAIKAR